MGPFNRDTFTQDLDRLVARHVTSASVAIVIEELLTLADLLEHNPDTRTEFGIEPAQPTP